MKAIDFSIGFLTNLYRTMDGKRVPLYGIAVMLAIHQGNVEFSDISTKTGFKGNSLYCIIQRLSSHGLINRTKSGTTTLYELTEEGKVFVTRLFSFMQPST